MPLISSANIACGVHAGDAESMREAVALAIEHGVAIGAHPSFPDREHFGRREMQLGAGDLHQCIVAQIESLVRVAQKQGARLRHVKPHGALYNMAVRDGALAESIARAVHAFDPSLILFALPGSELVRAGEACGLAVAVEGFADRSYEPDGSLTPRSREGAVIHDVPSAVDRAVRMAIDGRITASDGSEIVMRVQTICIHGDTPGAPQLAREIRAGLERAGVTVAPISGIAR